MSNMADARWRRCSTSALASPPRPTRRASMACTLPSTTARRSTWRRCPALILPRSRARPSGCGSARWSISCRSIRRCGWSRRSACSITEPRPARCRRRPRGVAVGAQVPPRRARPDARDIFLERVQLTTSAGLTADALTYRGKHFAGTDDVPMALRPLQQPHPPFWYASSRRGRRHLGRRAGAALCHARTNRVGESQHRCRPGPHSKRRGTPAQPKPEFPGGAVICVSRYIFVADCTGEARRIAQPAVEAHVAHVKWLATERGDTALTTVVNVAFGASFDDLLLTAR